MKFEELKKLNRIKVNVDENTYGYDHLVEIRAGEEQECERCLKPAMLWFPDEDAAVGLCDTCLIESYGQDNIEKPDDN